MRNRLPDGKLEENIEWERAPGEVRRLPWLFGDAEPDDAARAARIRVRLSRWRGHRAENNARP
jgi:hypothetical protein